MVPDEDAVCLTDAPLPMELHEYRQFTYKRFTVNAVAVCDVSDATFADALELYVRLKKAMAPGSPAFSYDQCCIFLGFTLFSSNFTVTIYSN